MEGIILKALSGFYYVDGGDGALTACRGRGKFRHQKLIPLVGDRVRFTPLGEGAGILDEILPRKNQFQRPAVANIDQLVVIASGAVPVTDPFLIDRVVSIAEGRDCEPVICINKCDLDAAEELYQTYRKELSRMEELFSIRPQMLVCDLHPGYMTTQLAETLAEETGRSLLHIQHHHAHAASVMAEHGLHRCGVRRDRIRDERLHLGRGVPGL